MDGSAATPASKGALFLVATPIGNLEDITFRAVRVLKECDAIYAEDTRRTRVLLDRYEISKPLFSYHAFNERGRTPELLRRVLEGSRFALVTDAGMPCVADPGFLLVREAVKLGIEPEIIPGASSLTFAIAASGLPSDKFAFYGFLPVKSGRRSERLSRIAAEDKSVVIFESPYRIGKLLSELEALLPDVQGALIREATKMHEEVLRGSFRELVAATKGRNWKGECVLVVSNPAGACDEEEPACDETPAP
jgi:16S rRNA (cytidine1402-2'-O)-methyltransferase